MIGRNDLCSCGSNKKYKKCCLNKDNTQKIVNRKVEEAQAKYASLYQKVYNYSIQEKFEEEYKKAKEMFYILDKEDNNINFERLFNTYFMIDHIMETKKVMTVAYYEENANSITTTENNIMRSLFESFVSVYRIENINDGDVILKDILTNENIQTQDIKLLGNFNQGDLIIARVIDIEGVNVLVDITVSISESIKDVICNDLERLFDTCKDVYKEMKVFLIHHTHILYRYVQQLLDPSIAKHLQEKMKNTSKETNAEETTKVESSDCVVCDMLKDKVEEEYLSSCIDFWNEYKSNNEAKGSENGWAAAVEYHIKKEAGVNATQTEISKKYDTSSSTLGKRYKELKSML